VPFRFGPLRLDGYALPETSVPPAPNGSPSRGRGRPHAPRSRPDRAGIAAPEKLPALKAIRNLSLDAPASLRAEREEFRAQSNDPPVFSRLE
jgi:hypothetical protein